MAEASGQRSWVDQEEEAMSGGTLLDAALIYAFRGWPVLPLHTAQGGRCSCGRPVCPAVGKHPRTRHGSKDATLNETIIRQSWEAWPQANVGIATGTTSGLLVVDIDPRHGGDDTLREFLRQHGPLPPTVEVLTGGGGRHLYFQHPGRVIKSRPVADGLDIKADGGYVVAPPSVHASGSSYVWEGSSHPDDMPIALLPAWLEQVVTEHTLNTVEGSVLDRIPQGIRNHTLTRLAGNMRRPGMSHEAIEAALLQENAKRCDPPLPEPEVRAIAASVARYPPHLEPAHKLDSRLALSADRANRANPPSTVFRFTELKALLAEPEEQRPYLVDRLLPMAGFSILAAKPKVGKSTFARNLALAIARGECFIDRQTVAGPVVYLALEEKRPEVQRHFQRMGAHQEPVFIHVGSAPEEAVAALAEAIGQHQPVLAIVDPLLKLVRVMNANDYAEVSRVLEPLIELARTSGCHLLCVHHLGKGERSGSDALLGSTALFAAVDTLLMMKRRDQIRTIETQQRYGDDLPETVVAFEAETGRVMLGGSLASIQLDTCMREVLQVVREEERTEPQIKATIGGNQTTVAKAIRRLVDMQELARAGTGRKHDAYRYRRPPIIGGEVVDPVPHAVHELCDTTVDPDPGQDPPQEERDGTETVS